MDLNFFNKLNDATKDNNGIQGLIEDLGEFLENKFAGNKELERKGISLIQEMQEQGKVTTTYRDKMLVERSNILNEYAKGTSDKGTMYFVYSKNSAKANVYNLCICEDGMSNKVISVEESELPNGAGVDSVLRLENGKYVLDEKATEHIFNEMHTMVQKLLEEQTLELSRKRVEGNIYEIVEISGDTAWLMNTTKNDGDCFEEISISKDVLDGLNAGDLIQYVNGEYKACSK